MSLWLVLVSNCNMMSGSIINRIWSMFLFPNETKIVKVVVEEEKDVARAQVRLNDWCERLKSKAAKPAKNEIYITHLRAFLFILKIIKKYASLLGLSLQAIFCWS